MAKFACNKLARDKTIELIQTQGTKRNYRLLTQHKLLDALHKKLLLRGNFRNKLETKAVHNFVTQFVSYVKSVHGNVYESINASGELSAQKRTRFLTICAEFSTLFVPADVAQVKMNIPAM